MLSLGYPRRLICVEKALHEIVGFSELSLPARRLDILCFSKKKHEPLLLVECKAHSVRKQAFDQLIAYNFFIKAPYIALADPNQIIIGWLNQNTNQYEFTANLPSYEILCP